MENLSKRKKRFLQMFSSPNSTLDPEQVAYASELIDRFPRQDVAMYVLRQYKLSILYNKTLDGVELNRNEVKFLSLWMGKQLDGRSGLTFSAAYQNISDFKSFISQFQHYQEMNIPSITNTELISQAPVQLFRDFDELEKRWIKKQSRQIHVDPYDENEISEIIYEKDGLYVFDTHTFYSPEEAKAMGHCGNQYGNESQRLLSVRSKVDKDGKIWKPHTTIILNRCLFNPDGSIKSSRTGEIKGFANDAPNEKYHNFIGEFFVQSDFIKGMDGGEYLRECDLQFTDFSKDIQGRLLEREPTFIRAVERLIFDKGEITPTLIEHFKREYSLDEKFMIREFSNLREYASNFNLDSLKSYADEDYFFELDFETDASSRENLLAEIFSERPDSLEKIQSWALEQGIDEEIYSLDASGISSWANDENNELHSALDNAVNAGYRYGSEAEAFKAIDDCLDGHKSKYGFEINSDDGYFDKISIHTTIENAIKSTYEIIKEQCGGSICKDRPLIDASENSEMFDTLTYGSLISGEFEDAIIEALIEEKALSDLNVPQYGFQDYSLENACEVFAESLYEDLDIKLDPKVDEPAPEPQSAFMNAYYEEQAKVEGDLNKQEPTQIVTEPEVKSSMRLFIPKP